MFILNLMASERSPSQASDNTIPTVPGGALLSHFKLFSEFRTNGGCLQGANNLISTVSMSNVYFTLNICKFEFEYCTLACKLIASQIVGMKSKASGSDT